MLSLISLSKSCGQFLCYRFRFQRLGIGEGDNVMLKQTSHTIRWPRLLQFCDWGVLLWTVFHCNCVISCEELSIVCRWPSRVSFKLTCLCWRSMNHRSNKHVSDVTHCFYVSLVWGSVWNIPSKSHWHHSQMASHRVMTSNKKTFCTFNLNFRNAWLI